MPGPVQAFERRGAIAQIYIHPGERIHEGICTSIWGAPTAESIGRKPATPVVCINQPDGTALIADSCSADTVRASIRTWLREGWMRCLLPVAEIRGQSDPDEFLLVHGHYDSWYEGIGDNATGDAALLELARVLWTLRDRLKRSVRIAWWPGHSTGRYAGSTWYADTFADEIDEHCIAQLDIDSPGCADATAYEEVMWMAEADSLCRTSIRDALGLPSERVRPLRAGDYSFNQIGPTGLYMLLSNIPIEERKRRGYYAVGGCGGNTAWHTPDDLMPVADLEILRRDLAVYLTTIVRIVNAPLHPFDYAAAVEEIRGAVAQYQQAAGGEIDFGSILDLLARLGDDIRNWRTSATTQIERAPGDAAVRRRLNGVLRRLARLLVPLNYARGERFDHDPALKFGAVPAARSRRQPGVRPGRPQAVPPGGAGARIEQGPRDPPCRASRARHGDGMTGATDHGSHLNRRQSRSASGLTPLTSSLIWAWWYFVTTRNITSGSFPLPEPTRTPRRRTGTATTDHQNGAPVPERRPYLRKPRMRRPAGRRRARARVASHRHPASRRTSGHRC